MKKRSQKARQAGYSRLRATLSALMALILCAAMLTGMAPKARAAGDASLTVRVPEKDISKFTDLSKVTIEMYRIGSKQADGWHLDDAFKSLEEDLKKLNKDSTVQDFEAVTDKIEAIIDADSSIKPTVSGTMAGGSTTLSGERGYYLVRKSVPSNANDETPESKQFDMLAFPVTLETQVTVNAKVSVKDNTLIPISVEKSWQDGENNTHRPKTIQVRLLANGKLCTKSQDSSFVNPVTLNADGKGNWSYTWKDLFVYDLDGKTPIQYSVQEIRGGKWVDYYNKETYTPTSAKSSVDKDGKGKALGFTITNPHKTGSLWIEKSVTVGGKSTTGTLADGRYKFTITGVDCKYSGQIEIEIKNGKTITKPVTGLYCGKYTIKEETPTNGTKLTSGNNISVTVSGDKVTKVATASFVNNATPTPTPTPTPPPTTRPPSNRTTPPPTETTPPPSEPTPTPPPTTEVNGQKIWRDDDDVHGLRPDDITVELLADGVVVSSAPIWRSRTGNTWSFSFINLPVEDEDGNTITYTVRELPVEGYTATVDGNTIINELIPRTPNEYINIAGVKIWDDGNNALGNRPNYITVRLLRDGEEIEQRTVTAANEWQYAFQNLPQDDGYGHTYTYTLREDTVAGYFTRINGYNITNSRLPETIEDNQTPLGARSEEGLEELLDLFDYGTPLFGELLQTGDETPIYPYIFGGIGALAVLILLVAGRRRRREEE